MINEFITTVKNKWEQRKELEEKLRNKLKEYKFLVKPFLIISIIFAIGIISIIRANFYYIDDLRRAAEGYAGWNNFSRFASTFLSTYIHADKYLTDISPLPQLLAVFIMALASIIILYVYKEEKKFSFWDIIAIIPLGLSPYFLECFSYKYDAPYMAIAVFSSVFPLLFRKKKYIYSIITILCTLLMCMTYQAASGIFLMFVLLISLKNWNRGDSLKETFKFLMTSIINYLIGLLIFKLFIMKPINTYVSNQIFDLAKLIPGALKNFEKYLNTLKTDFKEEWLILVGLIMASFIYVFVRDSKRKKYIALPVNVMVLIMMSLLSFGMYPILKKTLYEPRAMIGFGAFIALMAVVIASSKKAYLSKIVVFILSWMFFVFGFTYGNALEAQGEYTDFRINLVIEDLNDLEVFKTDKIKSTQISGTIGKAPILNNMPKDYNILNRLVPVLFQERWIWGEYYFYNYFGMKKVAQDRSSDYSTLNLPVLKDTIYHTIKGDDTHILIILK